jgi:hypothetical protein
VGGVVVTVGRVVFAVGGRVLVLVLLLLLLPVVIESQPADPLGVLGGSRVKRTCHLRSNLRRSLRQWHQDLHDRLDGRACLHPQRLEAPYQVLAHPLAHQVPVVRGRRRHLHVLHRRIRAVPLAHHTLPVVEGMGNVHARLHEREGSLAGVVARRHPVGCSRGQEVRRSQIDQMGGRDCVLGEGRRSRLRTGGPELLIS